MSEVFSVRYTTSKRRYYRGQHHRESGRLLTSVLPIVNDNEAVRRAPSMREGLMPNR